MGTALALGEQAQLECDGLMHRSVVVQGQGGAVLAVEGEDSALTLMACTNSASTEYVLDGSHGVTRAVHWSLLPPGSYAMMPGSLPRTVQLVSSIPVGWIASSCDDAGALMLDPSAYAYIDLPPGRVDGWLRVAQGYGAYQATLVQIIGPTEAPVVFVCDGCSAAAACVPIPAGQVTPVVLGPSSFVHFQGAIAFTNPDSAWAHFILFPAVDGGAPP